MHAQAPQEEENAAEGLPGISGGACELLQLAGLATVPAHTTLW